MMPQFPENVSGGLPHKPNVFTDGGLKHPDSNLWALGGFGIWWPDTDGFEDGHQLHKFTHQEALDQGILMWGSLPGLGCSSTRTELAAALMALLSARPVHIARDSKAMIDKASKLIKAAEHWQLCSRTAGWMHRNPCGKPWGMQTDGDLWEQFWTALHLRGPGTVCFTKVKGHATAIDIAAGRATTELAAGNNHADTGATRGTDQHLPGLLSLAEWLSLRHKDYCKFMVRIHKVIVAVLQKEKHIRAEKAAVVNLTRGKHTRPTVSVVPCLMHSVSECATLSAFLPAPAGQHRFRAQQNFVNQVHRFLSDVTIDASPSPEAANTSWVELFLAFQILG